MLENPAILKKFVLAPHSNYEHLVPLYFVPRTTLPKPGEEFDRQQVVAVYRRTGRGPFRAEDGSEGFEFEYIGVRIV